MKKLIGLFIVSSVFAACNNNPKSDLETNKSVILTDTSRMYKSNMMTDTGSMIQTTTVPAAKRNAQPAPNNTVRNIPERRHTNSNRVSHRSSNNNTTYNNNSNNQSGTVAQAPARRRGWSHAAKGAAIGGVGGAVTGAVISKDHSKGAIIGGVLGAAGGYIIGRGKDKREGR